jgi:membrane protein
MSEGKSINVQEPPTIPAKRRSKHGTQRYRRLAPGENDSRRFFLLVLDLIVGILLDLFRRFGKSWTESLKREIAVRRKSPSSRPLAEQKATGMVPSIDQQTGSSPGTNRKEAFPKGILELFQRTASQWSRDKCPQLGAALAYYTVFSLAPLVLLLLGIFGLIYGSQQAREKILEQLRYLMDPNAVKIVEDIANNAAQPKAGIIATAIGILIALFGASGIFGQLQDALNTIWSVKPKPGQGIWGFIRTRFLSFGMVAGVAFLLLVSLTLEGVLKALHSYLQTMLPGGDYIGLAIFYLFDLAIIVLLFAMIFRYLPDAKIAWKDVWAGAALTAILFVIGKFLLGLYLGSGAAGSAYGAASSLVTLLLWVFYSAQILLFGGEFTKVYADFYGSPVLPDQHAVRVEKKETEVT